MRETRAADRRGEDDSAVVARARKGEAAAFDLLYRKHRDQVYSLCLNFCRSREQARDLPQEVFLRAWRGMPGFRGRSSFSTWLYRIAVNACRENARRKQPAQLLADPVQMHDFSLKEEVRITLAELSPNQRLVLHLRYSEELSIREIAERLGWPCSRAKVTLYRARLAFRKAYLQTDESES